MGTKTPETTSQEAKPKRIRTLAELAEVAGVSTGTVSRALADKPIINAKTRARIQELARQHGFQINQMASKLRRQKTGVIGVVIPLGKDRLRHVSDPFFMALLGALADELTENGYDLMLSRAIPHEDAGWLDRIVNSGMVDGVLMIGQSDQFETIEQVARDYLPLVVWGGHQQGQTHCTVGIDNFAGGKAAAQHLLDKGRHSLAFLGSNTGIEFAQRHCGAQAAVDAFGKKARLHHIAMPVSIDELNEKHTPALEAIEAGIDGIVAATDAIAMAVIQHLNTRDIKVPEEVAIIGFDDLPHARFTVPPLTTVRQDIARGATEMVKLLLSRLEGQESKGIVMPPQLIERASA